MTQDHVRHRRGRSSHGKSERHGGLPERLDTDAQGADVERIRRGYRRIRVDDQAGRNLRRVCRRDVLVLITVAGIRIAGIVVPRDGRDEHGVPRRRRRYSPEARRGNVDHRRHNRIDVTLV